MFLPTYNSSPEKRRIIEEQIDKWLELGVVEPSVSPWEQDSRGVRSTDLDRQHRIDVSLMLERPVGQNIHPPLSI
jgi:hypothetical protein